MDDREPSLRRRLARTGLGRRAVQAGRVLLAPREWLVRRSAAREALAHAMPRIAIDERTGHARFGAGELAELEPLLAAARAVLADARPHLDRLHATRSGNRALTVDLFSDELLARERRLVDVALDDAVLLPVVQYLRTAPFLARVALAHSAHVAELAVPAYHQRFHLDNDDFRHVKAYLFPHDVGEDEGPACFLPADASARVLRALAREGKDVGVDATFDDADVFRHASEAELVRATGPAGAGFLADFSRCLHYGSRVRPGRERAVVVLELLRYHRVHENASNQLEPPRAEHDRLRRLALSPPRRRPRGTFLGDPLARLGGDEVTA